MILDKIEVQVLNTETITTAEDMLALGARITQHSHEIKCMADLIELLHRPCTAKFVGNVSALPHPSLQKLGKVTIAVVGASRRFLGQIRTHQFGVTFVSGSLQYSDYSDDAAFCVPYTITKLDHDKPIDTGYGPAPDYRRHEYLKSCHDALDNYRMAIERGGLDHDAAGYMMPQGMRNVLLISAEPFEFKHMISQRICNRNTPETQFVMLRIWEELITLSPMFDECGPFCMQPGGCLEGKMSCGHPLYNSTTDSYRAEHQCSVPTAILDTHFPLIWKK